MIDPLDDAQQPRCQTCGTVLRPAGHGLWCGGCDVVVIDV
jgi:tRNA(Ile2) C34 agmatinyltransferase TiaS